VIRDINNNNNNKPTLNYREVCNIEIIKFSGRERHFVTVWAVSQYACLEEFNFWTVNFQSITGLWQHSICINKSTLYKSSLYYFHPERRVLVSMASVSVCAMPLIFTVGSLGSRFNEKT